MGRLVDHWLAPGMVRRWSSYFPEGRSDLRAFLVWVASIHDVGKASPAFACQCPRLDARMDEVGLHHGTIVFDDQRREAHHTVVGQLAVDAWARERGIRSPLTKQVSQLVGVHHGRIPEPVVVREVGLRRSLTGDKSWVGVRREFLDLMASEAGVADRVAHWGEVSFVLPDLVDMSGLLIIADWLASNETYFPYLSDGVPDSMSADERVQRLNHGYEELAFPDAWAPDVPDLPDGSLYSQRFGWPQSRHARPLQRLVVDLARRPSTRLMIIESPTGSGKTEAALIATEVLAASLGLAGAAIFLPTQATTNAMFSRVVDWLDRLPAPPEAVPAWALTLAHGKASLNPRYRRLKEEVARMDAADAEGELDAIYDTERLGQGDTSYAALSWFQGRQRPLLANFSVGTIDQLLMMSLKSKHLMLRHLGLASKALVLDEVHAADEYMEVYLDRALGWLGANGTPVVILSATLTGLRRRQLAAAYGAHLAVAHSDLDAIEKERAYPLVTVVESDGTVRSYPAPAPTSRSVRLDWGPADPDQLAAEVGGLGQGCILVIRNTVKAAQRTVDALRRAGLGPVTLTHSRFMASDRADRDDELLRMFGPDGDRPEHHIVVATQVVEQSLDIDFDVLFTDIAPMDLLFQRIGRLHRHPRNRPSGMEEPRCVLLAEEPPSEERPVAPDKGSVGVYGAWRLLRTGLVLKGRTTVSLPGECPALLNEAFDESLPVPSGWEGALAQALEKRREEIGKRQDRARHFLLADWNESPSQQWFSEWFGRGPSVLKAEEGDNKGQAMVRDSDPTLEVILVPVDDYGQVQPPPWRDEAIGDVRSIPDAQAARTILGWAVHLPPTLTTYESLDAIIDALSVSEAVARWDWNLSPLLRGELFLPMQIVAGTNELVGEILVHDRGSERIHRLRYHPDAGLEEL